MDSRIAILNNEILLLPYHVRHYKRLGADRFPFLCYGSSKNLIEDTIAEAGGIPIHVESFPASSFYIDSVKPFGHDHRVRYWADYHTPGEWAFYCDIDEFVDTTAEEINSMISSGARYIWGRWVDRIGHDNQLVSIDSSKTLESQFPLCGRFRVDWGTKDDDVYIASPFAPYYHHPRMCKHAKGYHPYQTPLDVHHFKWRQNVRAWLNDRRQGLEDANQRHTGYRQCTIWQMSKIRDDHMLQVQTEICKTKLGV